MGNRRRRMEAKGVDIGISTLNVTGQHVGTFDMCTFHSHNLFQKKTESPHLTRTK